MYQNARLIVETGVYNENMQTGWIKAAGIISIVAFIAIIIRLLIAGNEDTWLCVNGSWVQHGNPVSPKPPAASCGWPSVELDN